MRLIESMMSRVKGTKAEQQAKTYLVEQGLQFHSANYHSREGEIDLIMREGPEWVFVEVKYRSRDSHGSAAEYFHTRKRKKFIKAMQHFMQKQRLNPAMVPHRIDLVAIDRGHIDWIKHV